jgi:molybdate transport repressor ModE-like protein
MDRNEWLGVELRHLAALAAVQRTGSFRGAADELGYVQSAVSQQIARLEDVVNMRLIERARGRGTVALTPAGETLLEHADAIVAHLSAARQDVERSLDGQATVMRVAVCESVATRVLPRMLPLLGKREPELRVLPFERESWEEGRELVASGQLDAAFDYLPLDGGPFEHVELLSFPCVLLVQPDSPLAQRDDPPTLEEIARLPLIEHPVWRFAPRLEVILGATGRAPIYAARSNLNRAVQSLVAAGIGAAVMPQIAVEHDRADTAAIDLTGVLPPARISLFWHGARRPYHLDAFVAAAREVCGQLDVAGGEPPLRPQPLAA